MLTLGEWDYTATSVTTKSSDSNPENQDSFLCDLEVPVVLSEAYAYVLFDVSVDVYLVEYNLVYTVEVPMVTHSVFSVFRVIPFPMQVKGMEGRFTLIQPEKEFIVTDNIKGYYAKLEQKIYNGVKGCKSRN